MTKDEALKMALESLENSVDLVVEDAYNAEQLYGNMPTRQGKVNGLKVLADEHQKAITAIKQALAQHDSVQAKPEPEQEPVAWMKKVFSPELGEFFDYKDGAFARETDCQEWTPLYTTPPQRKPLTDEQIMANDVLRYHFALNGGAGPISKQGRKVIDAVEAAHGIKEKT